MALRPSSTLDTDEEQRFPECVAEVLKMTQDELPADRLHKNWPDADVSAKLENLIKTWRSFTGDKAKLETQLKIFAVEKRWRELGNSSRGSGSTANAVGMSVPQEHVPAPQPGRFVRTAQGNTQGTRLFHQFQGGHNQPQVSLQPVSTRSALQAAAGPSQPVPAARGQGHQTVRNCAGCDIQLCGPEGNLEIAVCPACHEKQQSLQQGFSNASQEGGDRFQAPKIKSAITAAGPPARGAAAGQQGRANLRSLPQSSFYGGEGGGGGSGLDLRAPIIRADALRENAGQQQPAPSQAARPRRGQQLLQQQQPLPTLRRSASGGVDEEFQPGKRIAAAAKARNRRSAPVEDKEPIDLVDTSDDEGGAGADAARRAKTGGEAGPGPSSTAAAAAAAGTGQAGRGPRSKFDKLSALVAGLKCCFPQEGGKHSVEVTAEDLARLENGEFLNDTCIDFYIKYIETHLPDDIRARYHFFNSFFLKKLQEKPTKGTKLTKADRLKQDHDRVKKWTKHVDLFSKDFIFVPIHGYLHWSLVLICHPCNVVNQADSLRPPSGMDGLLGVSGAGTPLLLHLDSLDGNHAPKAIFEALRGYLELEWKRKMEDETEDSVPRRWKESFVAAGREVPEVRFTMQTLPGLSMAARLPKQNNHTDCGLFLLSYMDFFVAANPRCVVSEGNNAQNVHALDPQSTAANTDTLLKKNWFRQCNAARLRDHLRALICQLMLGNVSPDDQRWHTLECVVQAYDEKPHEMGLRYLQPVEYLEYVTKKPNAPEPTRDDDVLSNGSDGEGPMADPKDVLQSPSRHMTRAASKQAGIKPAGALPTAGAAGNRRRKVLAAGDAGPSGRTTGANESVVDLSSPSKVIATSPSASQQAPAGDASAGAGLACGEASPEVLAVPERMDVDGEERVGDHDDDNVVALGSGPQGQGPAVQGPSQGPGGESTRGGEEGRAGEPAPMRPRLQADAPASGAATQGPAMASRGGGPSEVEDLRASSGDEGRATHADADAPGDMGLVGPPPGADHDPDQEDSEPPSRRRCRRRMHRECRPEDLLQAPGLTLPADDFGTDEEKASPGGPEVHSSQEDPETLPGWRPGPSAAQAAAAAQGDPQGNGPGYAGRHDACGGGGGGQGHVHAPRMSAGKHCRKTKRPADMDVARAGTSAAARERSSAAAEDDTGRGTGRFPPGQHQANGALALGANCRTLELRHGAGAVAPRGEGAAGNYHGLPAQGTNAASQVEEPPPDGFVPGEQVDCNGDEDPAWLHEQEARLNRMDGAGSDGPSSDEERPAAMAPGLRPGGSAKVPPALQQPLPPLQQQQRLQQQQQRWQPAGGSSAAAGILAGHGTEPGEPAYRKHTRFPDDGGEPRTELDPIRPEEEAEEAAPSHCTGAMQKVQPPLHEVCSIDISDSDSADCEKQRRCSGAGGACGRADTATSQPSATEYAQPRVGVGGPCNDQAAIDAAVAAAATATSPAAAKHERFEPPSVRHGQPCTSQPGGDRTVGADLPPSYAAQVQPPTAKPNPAAAAAPAAATAVASAGPRQFFKGSRLARLQLAKPDASRAASGATGARAAAPAHQAAVPGGFGGAAGTGAGAGAAGEAVREQAARLAAAVAPSAAQPLEASSARERAGAAAAAAAGDDVEGKGIVADMCANSEYPPIQSRASASIQHNPQPPCLTPTAHHRAQLALLYRPADEAPACTSQGSQRRDYHPPNHHHQDHNHNHDHDHIHDDQHLSDDPQQFQAGRKGSFAQRLQSVPEMLLGQGPLEHGQSHSDAGQAAMPLATLQGFMASSQRCGLAEPPQDYHQQEPMRLMQFHGDGVSRPKERQVDPWVSQIRPLPPPLPQQPQQHEEQRQRQRQDIPISATPTVALTGAANLEPQRDSLGAQAAATAAAAALAVAAPCSARCSTNFADPNGVRGMAYEDSSCLGKSQGRLHNEQQAGAGQVLGRSSAAEQLQTLTGPPRPPRTAKGKEGGNKLKQAVMKAKQRWQSPSSEGVNRLVPGVPSNSQAAAAEAAAVAACRAHATPGPAALAANGSLFTEPQGAGPSGVAAQPSHSAGDIPPEQTLPKKRRWSELFSPQQRPPDACGVVPGPGPGPAGGPRRQPLQPHPGEGAGVPTLGSVIGSAESVAIASAAAITESPMLRQPSHLEYLNGDGGPSLQLELELHDEEEFQERQHEQHERRRVSDGGSLSADEDAGPQSLGVKGTAAAAELPAIPLPPVTGNLEPPGAAAGLTQRIGATVSPTQSTPLWAEPAPGEASGAGPSVRVPKDLVPWSPMGTFLLAVAEANLLVHSNPYLPVPARPDTASPGDAAAARAAAASAAADPPGAMAPCEQPPQRDADDDPDVRMAEADAEEGAADIVMTDPGDGSDLGGSGPVGASQQGPVAPLAAAATTGGLNVYWDEAVCADQAVSCLWTAGGEASGRGLQGAAGSQFGHIGAEEVPGSSQAVAAAGVEVGAAETAVAARAAERSCAATVELGRNFASKAAVALACWSPSEGGRASVSPDGPLARSGSDGGGSVLCIDVAYENDEDQADAAAEEEPGDSGGGGAEQLQPQEGGGCATVTGTGGLQGLADGGTRGEAVEPEDISADSVDIVDREDQEWKLDEADEDSADAFVNDRAPPSARRGSTAAGPKGGAPPRGKQQAGRLPRARRGRGAVRGGVRKGGQGSGSKPPSSTKGVTPSRGGGGAGAGSGGGVHTAAVGKRNQRGGLGVDAAGGSISDYRVKAMFPRRSKAADAAPQAGQSVEAPYDLTQED